MRLPLYAKVLGMFLLNVLLLAAVFLVVFKLQFRLGLDSLLAGQASQRVRALSQAVAGELRAAPVEQAEAVLTRFAEAYDLELYLFNTEGRQVAGPTVVLPPEIAREVRRLGGGARGFGGPGGPAQRGLRREGNPPLQEQPPPPMDAPYPAPGMEPLPPVPDNLPRTDGRGPLLRRFEQPQPGPLGQFFLRTEQPRRYWAGSVIPPRFLESWRPFQVLLIASPSLSGGGLFIDYTPWVLAAGGALALSALLWLPFVRGITRNVRDMSRTTEGIALGRFESRVASRRNDELGRLAEAINDMAGRLEGFVTGQRRFLGDIAHELCSPLARIQTALGILEQRADAKDQPYVKDLQEEAEHMSQLVGELLSFSKASIDRSKVRLEPTHMAEPVANAVRREQVDGVTIEQHIPEDLTAEANAELLQRALANLVRNAIRHAGSGSPITITGRREGHEVVLEVADRGPGVPEASLPRLFDPFYRVDESRTRDTGGVGLGLTIVKTCVESCGGTVSAANRPDGGLAVQIRLKGEQTIPKGRSAAIPS